MNGSADHLNLAVPLSYVSSRLTGRVYGLNLRKTVHGMPQFSDYDSLLNYLQEVFRDTYHAQNAQNTLYLFQQKVQDFSVFLADFQRLALEREVLVDTLPLFWCKTLRHHYRICCYIDPSRPRATTRLDQISRIWKTGTAAIRTRPPIPFRTPKSRRIQPRNRPTSLPRQMPSTDVYQERAPQLSRSESP